MNESVLLAVDDKPDNLYVIKCLVNEHLPGCRIVTAADAEQCLEIVRTQAVDAALVDVQMPGMSGIEMCGELKASVETAHIPVILITAHRVSGGTRRSSSGRMIPSGPSLGRSPGKASRVG